MADSNKTEKPTPQKRKKARAQGQVARSRELSATLALAGAVALVAWQIPNAGSQWLALLQSTLDLSIREPLNATSPILFWTALGIMRWVAPAMAAAWGLSVLAGVAQGGLVIATDALAFKPARLNPGDKLKQMFSLSGLSGILKSMLPFSVILWIGISVLRSHGPTVLQASSLNVRSLAIFLSSVIWEVCWKSGIVLIAWAGVDYFLNWRKLEGDLKMSRQEVRDESKQTDGNPTVKGRIRRLQSQMRRRQMLKDMEKASVVITNPTHFAVALKYDLDMEAPVVLAKGRDLLAQEIKEVARWHGIAIMENPPLAQALYRTAQVGQQIPVTLYTAVAEILAFVFRAQAQARQQTRGVRT